MNALESALDLCPELRARLDAALVEDCPLLSREGGFIRDGFRSDLDALRELATGGKQWIANYQASEATRTGIPNLKVGFNNVFGYYLEVTNPHRDKVPPEYHRRQTVKNAERYVTPELKEYEEKVLTADERAKQLEYDLFLELRDATAAESRRLGPRPKSLPSWIAWHACRSGPAWRLLPAELVAEPCLRITAGRHPVLDQQMPHGSFVPNDVTMSADEGLVLLITGPNMAGKSTFIRQTALIAIMAQMGSYVPAREATVGIADRIFARVGASDDLGRGHSTFMVEMTETAQILNTRPRTAW